MALSASQMVRQAIFQRSRNFLFRSLPSTMVVPVRSLQKHQAALPRLPVPILQDTMNKYLKTVEPVVTEQEFMVTQEIVQKFTAPGGLGQKLQDLLENRAANTENWLSDWWLNAAYLDYRWPVVVWSSPGLVFPMQKFNSLDEQLQYAAMLISGALDYKIMVDEKTVPIEKMGKEGLDMSQYFKIFSTCRIPGVTKDSVTFFGQQEDPPQHICVVHNNHYFKVDVYGKKGKPLNVEQILQQLRNIVDRSTHQTSPVGILSSQNRNVWGKVYKKLSKDNLNTSTIADIQSSIFVVCLDGPINSPSDNRMTDAALQCIHGNGSKDNGGNRWFDKTIQFVIGKKGEVGLTYEHTPAEGPPIANLMDHIVDYIAAGKKDKQLPAVELSKPKRLEFNLTNDIMNEINTAKTSLDSLVSDLEMTCFIFTGYGKNFIKSAKLSPDSYIQMAIQLAFYRIHKEPGAHYESASTRKFLHGRTETIRSCSLESVNMGLVFTDPNSTSQQKVASLREAVNAHKIYAKDAINGHGVDRHLLGLKLAAIEAGMDVPTLFMDVSYIRSSHMRLSTSQVPARCEAFMCYGPLVPDGYGCCYNPRTDSIVFGASALNSSPDTDSYRLKQSLEQSLMDIQAALLDTPAKL